MERRRLWQRLCLAPEPTAKGRGSPSMIAPGQKERFLFVRRVLVLPEENQVRVTPLGIREGVSHRSGRVPSLDSSLTQETSLRSHGACPCGGMSARTSET